MAVVKPFKAFRPRKGLENEVASLPYDVYNRKEAKQQVNGHPIAFLNIDRPETYFSDDYDMYAPEVYQKAHDVLWEMVKEGTFCQDREAVYYLYELTMNGRSQTGIVACASIDDYQNGVIKKHENTREEKEQDRIRHIDACDMQTGPIFLAYRNNKIITDITKKVKETTPIFDFISEDGIMHRGWMVVDSNDNIQIEKAFSNIKHLYIADGHHRAASAVKVGLKRRTKHSNYTGDEEFNYFLSVIFPDDELFIMPYNRVVKDLNGLSEEEFLSQVSVKYEIESSNVPVRPKQKHQVGMFLGGHWYQMTLKSEYENNDSVDGLDVSILQSEVLSPILGIGDPRIDERIDFVGGIRGLEELEHRVNEDCKVAFSMYPTSISELFAVADENRLMPPKSTWFEPKLRSGLFLHSIK
ncbi:HTH domain of SpoOJ/ParA/ParB/repB family, involved in chromosome partitioning [Lachnospiraceae bacterium TWA4]|nr:HTH domain of SpoOJ/ParA/ParB/repB family, involved in chromosome partitioning [Lachnospiraceae bacterium TWA4]